MEVSVERITPARAEKMLNRNCSNRELRTGLVEKYARDMANEKWTQCPSPIAVYEDGDIADGQHRLWAIVESGVGQTFIVARGLTREDGLNIDMGLNRTLVDNARISGVNTELSNRLIAVARAVDTGNRGGRSSVSLSSAQRIEMVEKHGEASRWALANAPAGRSFSHAIVVGAMARAWYWEEDKARLAQFAEVLGKGFMADEGDSAAIAIRNFLMAGTANGYGHTDVWRDAFLKVQNAIRYFMKHRKIVVIKSLKEEAYPLPKGKEAITPTVQAKPKKKGKA